jgi:hypothetical protein
MHACAPGRIADASGGDAPSGGPPGRTVGEALEQLRRWRLRGRHARPPARAPARIRASGRRRGVPWDRRRARVGYLGHALHGETALGRVFRASSGRVRRVIDDLTPWPLTTRSAGPAARGSGRRSCRRRTRGRKDAAALVDHHSIAGSDRARAHRQMVTAGADGSAGGTGFPSGAAAAVASLPSRADGALTEEERWQFVLSGRASRSRWSV